MKIFLQIASVLCFFAMVAVYIKHPDNLGLLIIFATLCIVNGNNSYHLGEKWHEQKARLIRK